MTTGIRLLLMVAVLVSATGCARKYWRKQADDLSYNLIRDKQSDPRWATERVEVETDPRSRFFEAYDPDFEPLPPDDAAAHEFMHWVYGKRGWKHWHEFGDQASIENPHWLEPFGVSQDVVESNMGRPAQLPEFRMTLEDAIDISYIHSRDYQTQIENVYLAALSLTLQRFAFDVQFIGLNGLRPSSSLTYTDIPSTSDGVNVNSTAGVSQLLPTGAQWFVQLANNTLWLFSSGNVADSTASTLSYSLVQPLLAGGGRRFVMEGLTQSERSLLYAVRDLARYRQGFFTSTVAGGFTAGINVGIPGVFSGTGPIPTTVPTFASGNGGFLGLLQLYQQVANSEYNIRQIREQLDRLRAQAAERPEEFGEPLAALPAGLVIPDVLAGRVAYDAVRRQLTLRGFLKDIEVHMLLELSNDPAFQKAVVDLADKSSILTTNQNIVQLETQLASTINGLRTARANYLNGLDQYKLQLGLPIDMPITIDTSLLKPFELVDQRLIRLQDRLNAFVLEPPPIDTEHPDAVAMQRVADLMKRLDPSEPDPAVLRGLVDEMLVIRNDLKRDGVDVTEDDFRRAAEHRERTANLPKIDDEMQSRRDPKRDERLKETLLADFHDSESQLLKLQEALSQPEIPPEKVQRVLRDLADLREDFLKISQNFSVIQIDLRVDLIDLSPWGMTMEDAVATGLGNRLDLMNLRGAVMDARRKVEVAANQLQAIVNLVAAGGIQTPPITSTNENPFNFSGKNSSFQVGIQFQAPIQLVAQRNNYRAALVGYQQARRNYLRTEDQVKYDCRSTWRFLDINRRNFETLRVQVRAATAQLDIAAEQTAAPAAGGAAGAAPGAAAGGGGGGQAQGLQILNAVNSVLQAQNNLIQFWVSFEAYRLDIYNYMGTLEIDPEGYWTDEFYQSRARSHRENPNRLYPPLQNQASPPADDPAESEQAYDTALAPKDKSTPATVPTVNPGPVEPAVRIRLVAGEEAAPAPEKAPASKARPRGRKNGTAASTSSEPRRARAAASAGDAG